MGKLSRVLTVAIILSLTLAARTGPAAPQPPSKYDPYLNSVVVVRSSAGEGAGFFINDDGLLVTNHHVVAGDSSVHIGLRNGKSTKGTVLAVDEAVDLALISVPQKSPAWLEFVRPNEGGVGADVIAIGTAKGLSWSVSKGIISGLRDGADFNIGRGRSVLLIQTDAAINPGNSGGPLILLESGRVVGVNTISFKKHIAEGISFAVSSENVQSTFTKYMSGEVRRPPQHANQPPEQTLMTAKDRLKAWMQNPEASIARLTQKAGPTPAESPGAAKNITLSNAQKLSIRNKAEGDLLVITGRAKNNNQSTRSFIKLKGTLHDAKGQVLVTKYAYTGNFLSDQELATLPLKEIEKRLNLREGQRNANVDIQPGHSVTFMMVFDHIPSQASEWLVSVLSAE
ncbi:MAG: DUF3426 domain-containing protein [Thermodesulfobacteriota bacterium]